MTKPDLRPHIHRAYNTRTRRWEWTVEVRQIHTWAGIKEASRHDLMRASNYCRHRNEEQKEQP